MGRKESRKYKSTVHVMGPHAACVLKLSAGGRRNVDFRIYSGLARSFLA